MADTRIKILNWEKFNPRKDVKHPAWFAMSNRIMDDPKLFSLSSDEFKALVYILCQASQRNEAEFDVFFDHVEAVARISRETFTNAQSKLANVGVTVTCKIRTNPYRSVRNRHATDRQTDTHTDEHVVTPFPAIVSSWNEEIKRLKKVKKVAPKRLALIKKHQAEYDDDGWRAIFRKADKSAFLCGGGSRGWIASFDWVLKNSSRIEEGEFDGAAEELGAGSMRGAC